MISVQNSALQAVTYKTVNFAVHIIYVIMLTAAPCSLWYCCRWLRKLFNEADLNGDGTLDLKEVVRLMKKLNVGVSSKILKEKFKVVDDVIIYS